MQWQVEQTELANGLRVLIVPMKTESVTVMMLVKVGSRDEEEGVSGVSHFLEHMVSKGTEKWRTAMEVNKVIDRIGGRYNAFTSYDQTGYWVKVAKKHLSVGLEFIFEEVFKALLPAEEIFRERGVILEELKMYEDNPMSKVGREFVSLVYSATDLGRWIIGTGESVKGIKREDFLKHVDKWYQPENMVLVIAGGVEEKDLKTVRERFEKVGGNKIKGEFKPVKVKQTCPRVKLFYKPIKQAHFCLGVETFKRSDKDRYGLAVLNRVLGGNTSSRLWEEIREKRGLVYYVGSHSDGFVDTGYLQAQAGCDVNRVEEAIKVTKAEFFKLSQKATMITDKELKMAKENIKGTFALELEDSQSVAGLLADDLLMEGKVRQVAEIVEKIDKVEKDEVLTVAKRVFDKSKLNLVVVGSFKSEEKFAKLLS